MAREIPPRPDPGWLAWAFGPPVVPALLLLAFFGLLVAVVELTLGSFSIAFNGVGTDGFWLFAVSVVVVLGAMLVRAILRTGGARVVAYVGGDEVRTEVSGSGHTPTTSSERTTRR